MIIYEKKVLLHKYIVPSQLKYGNIYMQPVQIEKRWIQKNVQKHRWMFIIKIFVRAFFLNFIKIHNPITF